MIKLKAKSNNLKAELHIGGSKSESNRLLILQALSQEGFKISNLSISNDTEVMLAALSNESDLVDIGPAGTAMRFLTAYYAILEGRELVLTGSERMKQRPISELVNALRQIGADISYEENEGFPPLRIKGKKLNGGSISLDSSVSSQYISALMLIAPKLQGGLKINLKGKTVSKPYINMTAQLLEKLGIESEIDKKSIYIKEGKIHSKTELKVESDWSSASYHYSFAAISENCDVILSNYRRDSFQGDSALVDIYKNFGVETIFLQDKIRLHKTPIFQKPQLLELNLNSQPDLAQTIVVTCLMMGIDAKLTGLETLRIKETDRLLALKIEVEKLGGQVEITNDSLTLSSTENIKSNVEIETYEDHRMAMAFAPVCLKNNIFIKDPNVIVKSYPNFWHHLKEYQVSQSTK